MSDNLHQNNKEHATSNQKQKNSRPKARNIEKLSKALKANMARRKATSTKPTTT